MPNVFDSGEPETPSLKSIAKNLFDEVPVDWTEDATELIENSQQDSSQNASCDCGLYQTCDVCKKYQF